MVLTKSLIEPDSKIIGLGLNYHSYYDGKQVHKNPIIFIKGSGSEVTYDEFIFGHLGVWTWCEPELAIIVGRTFSRGLYIKGYTIACDVTCTDTDGQDHHLVRSKFGHGFLKLGKYTNPSFKPGNKEICGYLVDGDTTPIRIGILGDRILKGSDVLEEVNKYIDLNNGDVIMTGAPPISPMYSEKEEYLSEGDKYICKIEGMKCHIKCVFHYNGRRLG